MFVSAKQGQPLLPEVLGPSLVVLRGVWRAAANPEQLNLPTPRQGIDRVGEDNEVARGAPFVDVLDDPTERILALAWAYLDRQQGERVVELNFCEPDVPTAMAHRLASLAGKSFTAPSRDEYQPPLSFTNTRFIPRDRRSFIIRSFVHMVQQPAAGGNADFFRLAIVSGHASHEREQGSDVVDAWRIQGRVRSLRPADRGSVTLATRYLGVFRHLLGVAEPPALLADGESSGESAGARPTDRRLRGAHSVEALRQLQHKDAPEVVEALADEFRPAGEGVVHQTTSCCGMNTCPVDAYHRCAEARFRMPMLKVGRAEAYTGDRLSRAAALRKRATLDRLQAGYIVNRTDVPLSSSTRRGLAEFRIDCHYEPSEESCLVVKARERMFGKLNEGPTRRPGPDVLAHTVSTLLFGQLKDVAGQEPLMHLTYLSASECHDARFGVFTCYGRLTALEHNEPRDSSSAIESVTITPYTGDVGAWDEYAVESRNVLAALRPPKVQRN